MTVSRDKFDKLSHERKRPPRRYGSDLGQYWFAPDAAADLQERNTHEALFSSCIISVEMQHSVEGNVYIEFITVYRIQSWHLTQDAWRMEVYIDVTSNSWLQPSVLHNTENVEAVRIIFSKNQFKIINMFKPVKVPKRLSTRVMYSFAIGWKTNYIKKFSKNHNGFLHFFVGHAIGKTSIDLVSHDWTTLHCTFELCIRSSNPDRSEGRSTWVWISILDDIKRCKRGT